MSNITDFFSSGGGGLSPKFEEFTSSGIFTPSQALIDAGGYVEIFAVGGGQRGNSSTQGGCGGEVVLKRCYLTTTTGCTVTIGAGGTSNGASGGDTTFFGSLAGGLDIVALGGTGLNSPSGRLTSGAGGFSNITGPSTTISNVSTNTVINPREVNVVNGSTNPATYYASQYAYSNAWRYAYSYAYSSATAAGSGFMGYGAGGGATQGGSGISTPKANSGCGSSVNINAADGIVIVKWYQ